MNILVQFMLGIPRAPGGVLCNFICREGGEDGGGPPASELDPSPRKLKSLPGNSQYTQGHC